MPILHQPYILTCLLGVQAGVVLIKLLPGLVKLLPVESLWSGSTFEHMQIHLKMPNSVTHIPGSQVKSPSQPRPIPGVKQLQAGLDSVQADHPSYHCPIAAMVVSSDAALGHVTGARSCMSPAAGHFPPLVCDLECPATAGATHRLDPAQTRHSVPAQGAHSRVLHPAQVLSHALDTTKLK